MSLIGIGIISCTFFLTPFCTFVLTLHQRLKSRTVAVGTSEIFYSACRSPRALWSRGHHEPTAASQHRDPRGDFHRGTEGTAIPTAPSAGGASLAAPSTRVQRGRNPHDTLSGDREGLWPPPWGHGGVATPEAPSTRTQRCCDPLWHPLRELGGSVIPFAKSRQL